FAGSLATLNQLASCFKIKQAPHQNTPSKNTNPEHQERSRRMSIYDELGVRTLINASANITRIGGSVMPPEVVQAMVEASKHFVNLDELQRAVGNKLAELTHNEAAYVSSGAAAGVALATIAVVAGLDR